MSESVGTEEVVRRIKITLVGDRMVGKTCLVKSFMTGAFPEGDVPPTVFDEYFKSLNVDGTEFALFLCDTSGTTEFEQLRPLNYRNTDCFILCYAVDQRSSFANVETRWLPELKLHCPTAAIVLVGTKSDRLNPENPDHVTEEDGKQLKSKIQANAFILSSPKTLTNIDKTFKETVRAVVKPEKSAGYPFLLMLLRKTSCCGFL